MTDESGSPRSDAVCAVVVTYQPDSDFPSRANRIAAQSEALVVVDNASTGESATMLRRLPLGSALQVVSNERNYGIARALNVGVECALQRGFSWAILFDQDTEVDESIVENLRRARDAYPSPDRLAVIGSRFRDTHGRPAEPALTGNGGDLWQEVESVITSGSLLSLDAYAAIGPFRNEFFIDYVDTEYCLRARSKGYRVIETRRPLMSHTIGAPTHHRLLGKQKWTTNHTADRRYYIARNNTVLLREYGATGGGSWQVKSLIRCFRLCKRIALFESEKAPKIFAVCQGWWDAVRGRLGPRPNGAT